jgi:putrescine transport system substrate-binding protein
VRGGTVMLRGKRLSIIVLHVSAWSLLGCGNPDSAARHVRSNEEHEDDKVLNLYIWADDMAPDTISSFEKLTGIRVHVSYFDSPETLEARMLTGSSGFDVVVPTAAFIQRHVRSGAYLKLDKTKLPNLVNLDPALMSRVAVEDPGNAHGIVYTWGTFGIGYNKKLVAQALPNVSLTSWRLIFDPAFAAPLAKCGINIVDDPVGVVREVLIFLGKNPNTPSSQDFVDVEQVLVKIRPFIRNIDTSSDIQAMANGDICIALAYNGNVVQARKRAKEANNGVKIDYLIPEEGTLLWFDMLAIPRDAPHVSNAYLFINYLMEPDVIANITRSIGYANANLAATPLLGASIVGDTAIYPAQDGQKRLFVQMEYSAEQTRAVTRIWQRFKTGR